MKYQSQNKTFSFVDRQINPKYCSGINLGINKKLTIKNRGTKNFLSRIICAISKTTEDKIYDRDIKVKN